MLVVGVTLMICVVSPELHCQSEPAGAVNVMVLPLQTSVAPLIVPVGAGSTLTVMVCVPSHPLASVPTTV